VDFPAIFFAFCFLFPLAVSANHDALLAAGGTVTLLYQEA